jgi:hypothetical protein
VHRRYCFAFNGLAVFYAVAHAGELATGVDAGVLTRQQGLLQQIETR